MKNDTVIRLCILLEPAFSELDYDNKWIPIVKKHVDLEAFNCHFVTSKKSAKNISGSEIKGEVYTIPFPFSKKEGIGFMISYVLYLCMSSVLLLWLVPRHKIQVLISLGGQLYTGFIVSLISELMGVKSIVRVAEMTREEITMTHTGGSLLSAALHPIEKFVYKYCDAIVTNRGAKRLTQQGLKEEKIQVISQGVQLSLFHPEVPPKFMHSGFPKIISVSRLSKEKNLISLIRAIGIVKTTYPDCVATIVGEGLEFDRLSLEIKLLGLAKNVFLEGSVPHHHIPALLNGCDIFVLASIYEGLPSAMLEAMACGLPVIATPIMKETSGLKNGVNVIITDPTPQGIATAIIRLSSDFNLRDKIRKNALLFVKKYHDANGAKAHFSDVVNRLCLPR